MDDITDIIWDLDNVLYKFMPSQQDVWDKAVCKAAIQNGLDMDFDDALVIAKESWEKYKNSYVLFEETHDICRRKIHVAMYEFVGMEIVPRCEKTRTLMNKFRNIRHSILTAGIKNWVERVLDHTELEEFFNPDHIISIEDYDFEVKSQSPRGILTALEKTGSNPKQTLFVEDTLANLKPAKEHANVKTAYLHHGRPVNDNDMDYVDIVVKDTPELLEILSKETANA